MKNNVELIGDLFIARKEVSSTEDIAEIIAAVRTLTGKSPRTIRGTFFDVDDKVYIEGDYKEIRGSGMIVYFDRDAMTDMACWIEEPTEIELVFA